jgi:hypothetical protein
VLKALLRTKGFPGQTGAITIDPTTGNRTNVPVYILAVDDRSNRLEDRPECFPRLGRTAGHDGRPSQGALFTTRDSGTDEVDARLAHRLFAANRVGEQCV